MRLLLIDEHVHWEQLSQHTCPVPVAWSAKHWLVPHFVLGVTGINSVADQEHRAECVNSFTGIAATTLRIELRCVALCARRCPLGLSPLTG
jgi:hypothetical protein